MRKQKWLTYVIATGAVALLPASLASAPALAAATASQYHVDCAATASGDGSAANPWNTLAQANAQTYGPGDQLLFKKGSTCKGMLKTSGAGDASAPFTISDYGTGDARAVIAGQADPAAVHLFNSQHVVVKNLELTNAPNPGSARRGILVEIRDIGTGTGYDVENLYIHDVWGGDLKGPEGSQGISFRVSGETTPTKFDDVRIAGNRLEHIDRQGISAVLSTWSQRPLVGSEGNNWLGSTNILVENNTLSDLGGDGIVMNTVDGALVKRNTVTGFQLRSAGYNAGIWPYNANNTVFEYNDVSGGGNTLDGMAYDVDQGNLNTTFRYNYSHDNAGGFFLLCNNGPGTIQGANIHNNISHNDSFRGIENCRGGVESASFTNNSIYIGDGISQVVVNENAMPLAPILQRNVRFANNQVVKEGAGSATFKLVNDGYTFGCNVFTGVTGAPTQDNNCTPTEPQPGAATSAENANEAAGANVSISRGVSRSLVRDVLAGKAKTPQVQKKLAATFGAGSSDTWR